jgi:Fe2+ or Zn2+ uptake regulation protein
VNAEQLRQHLIDALAGADEPMTTSALLAELNARNTSGGARPIVVEQVYRGLRILAGKGLVRRLNGQPGRAAHWTHIAQ